MHPAPGVVARPEPGRGVPGVRSISARSAGVRLDLVLDVGGKRSTCAASPLPAVTRRKAHRRRRMPTFHQVTQEIVVAVAADRCGGANCTIKRPIGVPR